MGLDRKGNLAGKKGFILGGMKRSWRTEEIHEINQTTSIFFSFRLSEMHLHPMPTNPDPALHSARSSYIAMQHNAKAISAPGATVNTKLKSRENTWLAEAPFGPYWAIANGNLVSGLIIPGVAKLENSILLRSEHGNIASFALLLLSGMQPRSPYFAKP